MQEKYFQTESEKLHYYQAGQGKTVLFLHGGGVNALSYKRTLDSLSAEYLIIAPDLPCFGKSSVPADPTDYSAILKKFISSYVTENIAVVGHSLGGFAALELASTVQNISRLVLIDSAGLSPDLSRSEFFYKFFITKSIHDLLLSGNSMVMLPAAMAFIENVFTRLPEYRTTFGILNKILSENFTGFNLIRAQTLILWGKNDEIFPKNLAENFHQNLKNSELKFVGGNHDWCLLDPLKTSRLILEWLKNNNY
jgi:pimeloyl-ACP methyl ester carboxylesterase